MFHTLGALKNKTESRENEPGSRIAQERKLVQTADGIVVPAHGEYENLLRDYAAQPDKIAVIPCGVDSELFHPIDQMAARKAVGLNPKQQVALFVGRFAPLKGLDLLLSAVARLEEKLPDLHLVVAGGDGLESASTLELIAQADRLGIRSKITFTGRIEHHDLVTYYNAADLLVMPSHYESFGLVVLEALACGTPVAATPFGAAEAVLQADQNGNIIPRPKAADVAQCMLRQLTQPEQERLSRLQIRETVADYSWPKIAAKVAMLYDQLIADHERSLKPALSAKACSGTK